MATFPKGHSAFLMRCENAEKIAAALRETGGHIERARPSRFEFPLGTDLRGIPAVGRGVAGVIPHTAPESVIRWLCDD